MKHRAMLFALLCLAVSVQAQEWEYSMTWGNQRNYRVTTREGEMQVAEQHIDPADLYMFIDSIPAPSYVRMRVGRIGKEKGDYFRAHDFIRDFMFHGDHYPSTVYVDSSGWVSHAGYYGKGIQHYNLYPERPWIGDTLRGRYHKTDVRAYGYRELDTTFYGYPVRAFTCRIDGLHNNARVVVADSIGLIRYEYISPGDTLTMITTSAIIDGRRLNADTYKYPAVQTCPGNSWTYVFEYLYSNYSYLRTYDLQATTRNDTAYYYFDQDSPLPVHYTRIAPDVFRSVGDKFAVWDQGTFQENYSEPITMAIGEHNFIFDTGYVYAGGENIRTFKVGYIFDMGNIDGGYTWEWADGIGGFRMDVYPFGGEPYIWRLIEATICEKTYDFRESEDVLPSYQPGDVRVYTDSAGENWITNTLLANPDYEPGNADSLVQLTTQRNFDFAFLPALGLNSTFGYSWYNPLTLDTDGVVRLLGGRALGHETNCVAYLTTLPASDTLFLPTADGEVARLYNAVAYDSVVLGVYARMLRYTHEERGTASLVTVGGSFGVVRVIPQGAEQGTVWTLNSAILGGKKFNRPSKVWEPITICSGHQYRYRTQSQDWVVDTFSVSVRDTIMKQRNALILPHNGYYHYDAMTSNIVLAGQPLRPFGNYGFWSVYPRAFTLGDTIWDDGDMKMVVCDTGFIQIDTSVFRTFTAMWMEGDNGFIRTWAEGLGLLDERRISIGYGDSRTNLIYAKTCDDDFTITGIDENPQPISTATRIFSAPYPNPVSLSQGAVEITTTQEITQAITVAVSDVLGRQVYILRLNPTGPGTALRIPLRNIGPGLYYLSINGASINETKKMVVVR